MKTGFDTSFKLTIGDNLSIGDNLHEVSNPIFWEKQEFFFKMSPADIITQHAKELRCPNILGNHSKQFDKSPGPSY